MYATEGRLYQRQGSSLPLPNTDTGGLERRYITRCEAWNKVAKSGADVVAIFGALTFLRVPLVA
ncbi:hypothetical protein GOL82_26380 [Sinorhizobium medicae]|nr:hypothetical protein [Sinorhizobium medicae]MDX0420173.1 hypothetical protein [Sinorhizobium medicae]MDX1034721.1 hypothetical protein [Sinorhizobium medicae]